MIENKKKRLLAYLEETALLLMQEAAEMPESAEIPMEPVWPHRSEQKIIRLRAQISNCEMELKQLENQMIRGDQSRVRRFRTRRRILLERLEQLHAARFAAASWGEYFLMFREDEKLRRSSWMDPDFYEKEREDICRKLNPCSEFCRPVEDTVVSLLCREPGEDFRKAALQEKLCDDVHWYAVGCLFLEQESENPAELVRG